MPSRSSILRITAASVGIVVAVGAFAAAGLVDLPTLTRVPPSVLVTPVPAAKQLVCPGSVLQLGNSGGQNASVASPLGQPSTTHAATAGAVDTAAIRNQDAGDSTAGSPTLLTVPASANGASISIAGAQHQPVDEGDYRGLAAAECTQPSSDSWLVGGATTVGRTTLLTLANPGSVVSTIAIEIFTADGLVQAPGTTGIVVPARGQRVLSLAGFAPDAASIALHVTSRGGPIAVTLQESIVRGIEASGVDIVGSTAAPSKVNVIPGVVIADAEALGERLGEEGFEDLATVLRLVVPGEDPAQATVRIVPEDPTLSGASFELTLDPGVVTDVPIEGLTDGAYSVQVESTVALSAAVRASTVAGAKVGKTPAGASDVAWFASATALTDTAFTSIAPGPGASLHLSNPGDQTVVVVVGGQMINVSAGASVTVEVTGATSYTFAGAAGLYASVSFSATGQLASYLVSSAANDEAPVTIYP
jgi:hypothetical protein